MTRSESLRAGAVGAATMTLAALLLRVSGLSPLNLELMLGSALTRSLGWGAWVAGLGLHLALGAGFGLVYGRFMRHLKKRGWQVAAPLALLHVLVAGLLLPTLAELHPLVGRGVLIRPRLFGADLGWAGPLTLVALHLVYGVTVGAVSVLWKTQRAPKPAPPAPSCDCSAADATLPGAPDADPALAVGPGRPKLTANV